MRFYQLWEDRAPRPGSPSHWKVKSARRLHAGYTQANCLAFRVLNDLLTCC